MSNKIGRPKVSKQMAKAILIGARFSGDESKEIEQLAKDKRQSKSEVLRASVLRVARSQNVWSSRWKAKDLDRQSVEFWMVTDSNEYLHGSGQFLAIQRGDGSIGLSIESHNKDEQNPDVNARIYISQVNVDFIEKKPEGSKSVFSLVDPRLASLRGELEKRQN